MTLWKGLFLGNYKVEYLVYLSDETNVLDSSSCKKRTKLHSAYISWGLKDTMYSNALDKSQITTFCTTLLLSLSSEKKGERKKRKKSRKGGIM